MPLSITKPQHLANYRMMSNLSAKVGMIQLSEMDSLIEKRIENSSKIRKMVEENQNLKQIEPSNEIKPVFLRYTVLARDQTSRDKLMKNFKRHGIEAGPINWRVPLHRSAYYRQICQIGNDYEGTDNFCEKFLNLPCHPFLREKDLISIKNVLSENL